MERLRVGDVRSARLSGLDPRTGLWPGRREAIRPTGLTGLTGVTGVTGHFPHARVVQRHRHVCNSHLAMNLMVKFPGIPEEGSTISTYDKECDRESTFCRTPVHVWEIHCPACRATGKVPIVRKRKSRITATCPRCSGLGFVRYVSARDFTEDDSEGFSLMRENQAGEYYNSNKLGRKSNETK